jgi:hypothetical protein
MGQYYDFGIEIYVFGSFRRIYPLELRLSSDG